MKLQDLKNGQKVRLRTGRPGSEDVVWGDWTERELYVLNDKLGRPAVLALKDVNWVEYAPAYDYCGGGVFLCEDYYLQIEGLTDGGQRQE